MKKLSRLFGALKSRNPAAYLAILIKLLSPVTKGIDFLLQHGGSGQRAYSGLINNPIVFIVCPNRSGGTVIFQALSRSLLSVYLSNIHALFPSLGTKSWRANCESVYAKQSFNNYYGYTSNLFDVYEGNEFFNWIRRFPKTGDELSRKKMRTEFYKIIQCLSPREGETVIFKNVRIISDIYTLYTAVPEIVFVRVKRDRNQLIESILRSYYDLGYFYSRSPRLLELNIKDPVKYAVAQVEIDENNLDSQMKQLPSNAKYEIPYEDFCVRPMRYIKTLAYDYLSLPANSIRHCPALENLRPSTRKKVSDDDRRKIKEILSDGEFGNK